MFDFQSKKCIIFNYQEYYDNKDEFESEMFIMNIWFIIAQVFGVVAMSFEFACYQINQKYDKTKYFLLTGIGSLFWMLMFVAIGLATSMDTQLPLVIAGTYSTIRNLVFFGIFKKDTPSSQKAGRIFLAIMMVIGLVAGTMTVLQSPEQVRWLHIIGLITALMFVVGQYLPGDHYVRITVVFYAVAVLLTQTPLNILEGDFRWNIMGILIESSKIISVAVFYILQLMKSKRAHDLQFIKYVIADEMSKIEDLADKIPVANIPSVSKVEKMMAKMVRYELKTVTSARIKDVDSTEDELQALIDDLKMVQRMKQIRSGKNTAI